MDSSIDRAIGSALKDLRIGNGYSARKLAELSGVSGAMISRIESGQVSPSISTLSALAAALQVPLVSLFRETTSNYSDFTFVKNGEGLKSNRIVDQHTHEFVSLAIHTRRDLQFWVSYSHSQTSGSQPTSLYWTWCCIRSGVGRGSNLSVRTAGVFIATG